MSIRKLLDLIVIVSLSALVTSTLSSLEPVSAQTHIFTDFAGFDAATGPLTEIDFENLPASSDPDDEPFIPNPLTLNGVIFTDPSILQTGFCSSPTCQPDPDSQLGGNNVLVLNQGATIDLPVGTGGAMLTVEGMGVMSFTLQVTGFGGGSTVIGGQSSLNDVEFLGFTSTDGIQQIEVVSVGPSADCTQPPCGPLILSALFVELDDPDVTIGVWTDPTGDVSHANADIIFGSATVSEEMVDLRVQFADFPFSDGHTHDITWCLDTDQNATTGNACGQPGADEEFTLSGELGSLFGGTFSFGGALASLDPCDVGIFNWDTNTLRLVIPLSMLSSSELFGYAVEGVFDDNVQVHSDSAPDLVDFGLADGFFTNVTAEFAPFNGTPLCSSNREASIVIPVQTTGSVEFLPERDILRVAPVSDIQSSYWKTTSSNRQFRRGVFELTIPELPDDAQIARVSLILTESRARVSTPKPPVVHEVSYYQPADLTVNTDDYTRITTLLTQTIETDENLPTQVFSVDITDPFKDLGDSTLGFRIKLAVDPIFSSIGNFGSGFGELATVPPRILVRVCDAQTTVDPTADGTLIYTDSQGLRTEVFAPVGAVSETTTLVYDVITRANSISSTPLRALDAASHPNPEQANRAFILDAYQNGTRQSGSIFQKPITVTLHYTDTDVTGLNEDTLILNYWNGSRWEYAACGPYDRHPDDNWLAIPICHLSEFALFGERHAPTLASVDKSVTPQGQIDYGGELTYTLVISAAPGAQVGLYDPLTDTTFLHFLIHPTGITHIDGIITGTLTVTPTNQLTVSFVAQVGVPGTAGLTVTVTNRACVYPVDKTLSQCVWSNEVANPAFHPLLAPEADFVADPRSGEAPVTVQFTSTTTGTVTAYRWSFGDDGVADTPNPTHTYQSAGSFGVTLVVTGPGGTAEVSKPGYITVNAPPSAPTVTFSADVVSGTAPLTVTFTAVSSGTVGHWVWEFGDESTAFSGPTVSHTYTTSGTFDVSLTVSNTHGSFTVHKPDYITVITAAPPPEAPEADFVADPRSGEAPVTVQFTSTTTGTVTAYHWSFGDNGVADTANPSHTYQSAGSFGVTLVVTGPGGTAEVSKPGYITVNAPPSAPTATFSADVVSGTVPLTVTFTAVSSGTVGHWVWDFGDESMAFSGPTVSHTYTTSGTFDVSLTVSNTHGSFITKKPSYIAVTRKEEIPHFVSLPLVLRSYVAP